MWIYRIKLKVWIQKIYNSYRITKKCKLFFKNYLGSTAWNKRKTKKKMNLTFNYQK
jgi:hypothetical protein